MTAGDVPALAATDAQRRLRARGAVRPDTTLNGPFGEFPDDSTSAKAATPSKSARAAPTAGTKTTAPTTLYRPLNAGAMDPAGPTLTPARTVRPASPSKLRAAYDRSQLPCRLADSKVVFDESWEELDYARWLPTFADGLRERADPCRRLAWAGSLALVRGAPDKAVAVIPQLIVPLKKALDTRHPDTVIRAILFLQEMLLRAPSCGLEWAQYYKQMLPVFNLFKTDKQQLGGEMDYGQKWRLCLGDLVDETLNMLEKTGGRDACKKIKVSVPTYESCLP